MVQTRSRHGLSGNNVGNAHGAIDAGLMPSIVTPVKTAGAAGRRCSKRLRHEAADDPTLEDYATRHDLEDSSSSDDESGHESGSGSDGGASGASSGSDGDEDEMPEEVDSGPHASSPESIGAADSALRPTLPSKLRFAVLGEREPSVTQQPLSPALAEAHLRLRSMLSSGSVSMPLSPTGTISPSVGTASPSVAVNSAAAPTSSPFAQQQREHQAPYPFSSNAEPAALPAAVLSQQPLPSLTGLPSAVPYPTELTPVQRAVLDYAAVTGQDPAAMWQAARRLAARHAARSVSAALACGPPTAAHLSADLPARLTAGVSYVVRSESRQVAVQGQDPLPHMVYRPPAPLAPSDDTLGDNSEVLGILDTLMAAPAAALVAPLRGDEAGVRAYLLQPEARAGMVQGLGATLCEVAGAEKLAGMLQDRSFVCLHYHLEAPEAASSFPDSDSESPKMRLVPCPLPSPQQPGSTAPAAPCPLAASNLQLGVTVRKGVGGTYPLRVAAKRLHAQGLLGALMDEGLPSEGGSSSGTGSGEDDEDQDDEGRETPAYQRLSMYTLTCRLELYVEEKTWEGLGAVRQRALQAAAHALERSLRAHLERRNWEALRGEMEGRLQEALAVVPEPTPAEASLAGKLLPLFGFGNNINNEKEPVSMDIATALVLCAACYSSTCELVAPAANGHSSAAAHHHAHIPWPLYFINTRDCFTHHLVPVVTQLRTPAGRPFTKTEWVFRPGEHPTDYHATLERCKGLKDGVRAEISANKGGMLPVGVTTYNEVFSDAELTAIEAHCDKTDADNRAGRLPPSCSHSSVGKGGSLKRTKFFFGARYLWTKDQLGAPDASIARGVRVDVPPLPRWARNEVEAPLSAAGVLPPDLAINSLALNMYHDGSEGIQVHFDDAARFQQPIHSLRLFSDSRFSFGTQLYGYTNGAFFVPMPRGCVTVMEAGGYAANGVKHAVRPADMAGKSAALILRRINPGAWAAAEAHFVDEAAEWMRCLSLDASLRAEALLAEARERELLGALGLGRRGPGRPPKLARQVARVMDTMLRAVEYAHWRERQELGAVAGTLARAVRRVAAAEETGLNVADTEDISILDVMDAMVEACEAPPRPPRRWPGPTVLGKRAAQRDAGGPTQKRPRTEEAEVEAVVRRMVTAVEAAACREAAAVVDVLGGIVRCVEETAAWEGGGQKGVEPAYAALGAKKRPRQSPFDATVLVPPPLEEVLTHA